MIGAAYEYLLKDFADSAGSKGDVRACPFPHLDLAEQRTFLKRLDCVDEQITLEEAGLRKLKATGLGIADGLLTGNGTFP
ncbi:hypothetical protein ABZS71_02005 [Streptomyces sp. NPDC005393]|uniref:hypothetical protein n=1 Tax=Streptomyces sp. NPDC005393 TaxID=3157041 RepID=UPI00339DDACC